MMDIPIKRMLLLTAVIQLLQCTSITNSLDTLSCPLPTTLAPLCRCTEGVAGLSLECWGLNYTKYLVDLEQGVASTVVQLELSGGDIPCLEVEHLGHLTRLQHLAVTESGVKQVTCNGHKVRHKRTKLQHLVSLNLSGNLLDRVEESLTVLDMVETVNVSHNQISHIEPVLAAFKSLKYLDISDNKLGDSLDKKIIEELPSTLHYLDISGNPWPCTPSLSWLYTWALTQALPIQENLNTTQCYIENSPTHAHSPLLTVMQYYSTKVNPHCPSKCSCHFYHFAVGINTSPTYTVIVNCSSQNLTTFPSLPHQTTVLDLSHNLLTQDSYDMLDVINQNYLEITSLILSFNYLVSIGTKLLKMKLHRSFQADNNFLSEIPYDFSLLLQKYDHNQIHLGSNPWQCSCNSEITDSSLQEKIQDLSSIICAEGSVPESIVGTKLMDIDSSVLCPRSEKVEEKEKVMQAVCVVLAFLIVITLTKLLYDYWNYRQRGKLPWIVYRMP